MISWLNGEQNKQHSDETLLTGRTISLSRALHHRTQLAASCQTTLLFFVFVCVFFLLFGFLWLDKRTFFFQTQLPIKAHYQENLPLHFRTLNEFLS